MQHLKTKKVTPEQAKRMKEILEKEKEKENDLDRKK